MSPIDTRTPYGAYLSERIEHSIKAVIGGQIRIAEYTGPACLEGLG